MYKVPLTRGKFALIDDKDVPVIMKYKWYYSGRGYAISRLDGDKFVFMHRLIIGTPEGMETDHIDRDKLNNQRSNLRVADRLLNNRNKGLLKNNTSGYRGIYWDKNRKAWKAYIMNLKKQIFIGRFSDLERAIQARAFVQNQLWGEV